MPLLGLWRGHPFERDDHDHYHARNGNLNKSLCAAVHSPPLSRHPWPNPAGPHCAAGFFPQVEPRGRQKLFVRRAAPPAPLSRIAILKACRAPANAAWARAEKVSPAAFKTSRAPDRPNQFAPLRPRIDRHRTRLAVCAGATGHPRGVARAWHRERARRPLGRAASRRVSYRSA